MSINLCNAVIIKAGHDYLCKSKAKDIGKGNDQGSDKSKGDDPDDEGDDPDDESFDESFDMMQISVKHPDGKTITLDVESTFTIKNIKAIIMNMEGTPTKQRRLPLMDMQLEDGYTISDYVQHPEGVHAEPRASPSSRW